MITKPVMAKRVVLNGYSVQFYEQGKFVGSLPWRFCMESIRAKLRKRTGPDSVQEKREGNMPESGGLRTEIKNEHEEAAL